MVEYAVKTVKTDFGDKRIEEFLESFGLKNKSIETGPNETLIYMEERQEKLTPEQMEKIESNKSLIHEICAFY